MNVRVTKMIGFDVPCQEKCYWSSMNTLLNLFKILIAAVKEIAAFAF